MNPETLVTLLADPSRADALPRSALPDALADVERLRAVLWSRLTRPDANTSRPVSDIEKASKDKLLTVDEAAERLGVTARWLYRKADSLPFTRKLGARTLRFSERGLEAHVRRKR